MAAPLTKYNAGTTKMDLGFVITRIPTVGFDGAGMLFKMSEVEMLSVSVAAV